MSIKQTQYNRLLALLKTNAGVLKEFLDKLLQNEGGAAASPSTESGDNEGSSSTLGGSGTSTTDTTAYSKFEWENVNGDTDKISETLEKYNTAFNSIKGNLEYLEANKIDTVSNRPADVEEEGDYRTLTVVTELEKNQNTCEAKTAQIDLPNEVLPVLKEKVITADNKGIIDLGFMTRIPVNEMGVSEGVEDSDSYEMYTNHYLRDLCMQPIKIDLSSWKQKLDDMGSPRLIIPFANIIMEDIDTFAQTAAKNNKLGLTEEEAKKIKWYHQSFNKSSHEPNVLAAGSFSGNDYASVAQYTGARYFIQAEVYQADADGITDFELPSKCVYTSPIYDTSDASNSQRIVLQDFEKIEPNHDYVIRLSFSPVQNIIEKGDNSSIKMSDYQDQQFAGKFWAFKVIRTYWGDQYLNFSFKAEGSTKVGIPMASSSTLFGGTADASWSLRQCYNLEHPNASSKIDKESITLQFYHPRGVRGAKNRNGDKTSSVTYFNYCGGITCLIDGEVLTSAKKLKINIANLNADYGLLVMLSQQNIPSTATQAAQINWFAQAGVETPESTKDNPKYTQPPFELSFVNERTNTLIPKSFPVGTSYWSAKSQTENGVLTYDLTSFKKVKYKKIDKNNYEIFDQSESVAAFNAKRYLLNISFVYGGATPKIVTNIDGQQSSCIITKIELE